MNIKRGLWRLATVSSTVWTGGFLINYFTNKRPNEEMLWLGLSGGVAIWICYWVAAGFFKDKTHGSEEGES